MGASYHGVVVPPRLCGGCSFQATNELPAHLSVTLCPYFVLQGCEPGAARFEGGHRLTCREGWPLALPRVPHTCPHMPVARRAWRRARQRWRGGSARCWPTPRAWPATWQAPRRRMRACRGSMQSCRVRARGGGGGPRAAARADAGADMTGMRWSRVGPAAGTGWGEMERNVALRGAGHAQASAAAPTAVQWPHAQVNGVSAQTSAAPTCLTPPPPPHPHPPAGHFDAASTDLAASRAAHEAASTALAALQAQHAEVCAAREQLATEAGELRAALQVRGARP